MYYKKHVFFCCNERSGGRKCCQDAGAREMRDYAKDKIKKLGLAGKGGIRINISGCLDRCAEGPVLVVYPEGVWYTYQGKTDIDTIIQEHLVEGKIVKRLLLQEQ